MQMHTPTVAVCLLQSLLSVFVLADNAAFNAADPLRDGDSATCRSVGWADFRLTAKVNVTHIRVYTNKTQQVSVDNCAAQAIWSPSFVDFFCAKSYDTNHIIIRNLRGSTCEIEVGTCAVDDDGKRYYGSNCERQCSDSCLGGLCGGNTGTCSSCPVGKTGSYCNEASACPEDHYGQSCSTPCPATCQRSAPGRVCDVTNGDCIHPCPVGRTGNRCDEASACPEDYYGQGCSTPCPDTCQRSAPGRVCDVTNGYCIQPCPTGKKGRKCNLSCGDQEYGANCNKTCSTCPRASGRQCDVQTGRCEKTCPAGQTGLQCESCTNDYYGVHPRCRNSCPSTCPSPPTGRQCDISYGHCTQPCPAGKKGNECNQDCLYHSFGQNCTAKCNTNCQWEATSGRYCDAVTGACLGLCSLGKRGVFCEQVCAPGTYGKGNNTGCPYQCGNCEGGSCGATDGVCTDGCKPGWQPDLCKKACDPGRYGRDCLTPCGKCNDSSCNHVDGQCNGVCKAGWKGSNCDEQCLKGTFGQGDRRRCPHDCGHCKGGECSPVDGWCARRCEPGWQSFLCSTSCDPGRYGQDCRSQCGNCSDSTCNHINGQCNGVCKAGWKGWRCDEPCDDKTFGDCSKQCACRNSSEVCNKSSGMCQSGCRDGKTGGDCQQDCPDRYFGNCKTPCLCKDRNERCDKVTGKCISGCPDGKSGDNCYQCQAGRYGIDCENTCHCRDTTEACDPASGACKSGCPVGWRGSDCQDKCEVGVFGDNCGSPCQTTCTNSSCHHVTGRCALGCVEGWEGDDCSKESSSVPVAAIAGSLAALIIIIIAVFGFCYWRRKKGKLADPGCEEIATSRRFSGLAGVSNHNHDNVVEENEGAVVVSKPETMEAMYSNAAPLARPSHVIAVLDLPKGLAKWRSEGRFNTEFQNLPQGLTEPHSAAYSAENKSKNRYANICAYDHSRVKLSVPPGSGQTDYINACFVDGYKSPRQFIASQGPNDVILYDFVRMLLEHDVSTVVMLTNLYEDGKPKCNQYWPEHTEATFGGITVTMTSMVTRRDYVIRDLTLSTKGGQRSVSLRHCHFLSWPDKGVPASPWPLLDFRDVAIENAPAGRPVVVHCSAGIGRTGTFIAMDVLLRQAQAEGSIDVLQCVTALRQARTQMVQTVEQYGFLHEAVLMGLCAAGSALPNDVFLQRYSSFMSPPGSNKSPVGKEFQKLMQCPFDISDEEVAVGKQPENKDKNVDPKILPVAGTRVQLMTSIPDSNGYINAIFLSDYEGRDKFILTQTPAANTVREFWAVVADFNVTAIVTLDSSPDKAYWPEKEEDFGPTKVQVLPPTDMEHFLVSSATVSKEGSSNSVKRFQLKKMPDSLKAKSDPKPLVTLREEVDKVKADGRVLVHSRNGAGLGGLYCVLSVLVRRAVEDRVVALPYSLSLVKRLRPQIVQSQNEYEFLYVAAKYHLDHHQPSPSDVSAEGGDEENIYANEEPEALYGNA